MVSADGCCVSVSRDNGKEVNITMRSARVGLATVHDVAIAPQGIGYVRIGYFGRTTGEEFRETLAALDAREMKGLVLDLRDNPGGLLSSAVEVAGALLPKGRLIVTLQPRTRRPNVELRAEGFPVDLVDCPIIVLVNHGSASASEIVAAALQDSKRAVLIGERTYGKGSVQDLYALPRGSALQTTTAHYVTPAGRIVDKAGIQPDLVLSEDRGELTRVAYERFRDALGDARMLDHLPKQAAEGDIQLQAALHVLLQLTEAEAEGAGNEAGVKTASAASAM